MRKQIEEILKQIENNLWITAKQNLYKKIKIFRSLKECKGKGIFNIGWCGSQDCGLNIEEELNMSTLGTPIEQSKEFTICASCGKETNQMIYVAKTY